jgi:hypothetical protein
MRSQSTQANSNTECTTYPKRSPRHRSNRARTPIPPQPPPAAVMASPAASDKSLPVSQQHAVPSDTNPCYRNSHEARILTPVHDVAIESLPEIAKRRGRLRIVPLQRNRRNHHPRQCQYRDRHKQEPIIFLGRCRKLGWTQSAGLKLHSRQDCTQSYRSESSSSGKTPSLGGLDPNCQLGNNFTPAAEHAGVSSFEPLIAHST